MKLQFEGKKRISAEESMTHFYFGNLGKRVMALPDSKIRADLCPLLTGAYRDFTIFPTVVSATSIFSLPEIQLEKETVRPTVSADPGSASVLIQTSVLLQEWVKTKSPNQFSFSLANSPSRRRSLLF